MTARIVVFGQPLHALEPAPVLGKAIDLGERGAIFRAAKRDDWPKIGRKVIVTRVLDAYGIPYTIEAGEADA